MTSTRELRNKISDLTPSDCGLSHHYVWKHGHELPPCPLHIRDSSLDCAHSTTPALTEVLGLLSQDPRVSQEFIKTARKAISVANDTLWVADLLAIDIADISQGQPSNETARHSTLQELRQASALRQDNSLDLEMCEKLIKDGQQLGSSLKLRVRSVMLSIIDSIEEDRPQDILERIMKLGCTALEQEISRAEKALYGARQDDLLDPERERGREDSKVRLS